MSDQVIECVTCGKKFTWTSNEQRYYKERGLSTPKHCPDCRAERRNEREAGKGSSYNTSVAGTATAKPRSSGAAEKRPTQMPMNPYVLYGFASFGLAIATAFLLVTFLSMDVLLAWLVSITVVAFLAYGFDKAIAGSDWMRVPERVLLWLAFAGGTLGALAGMQVFHHKTIKQSFRMRFWMVVLVQVVIVVVYFLWIKK